MAIKKLSSEWLNPDATAKSLFESVKRKYPVLYPYAEEATQGAIAALKKFGIGYICDYGDVDYVFRVQIDKDGNAIAWIDYAQDKEGTRRLESHGKDAEMLTIAFATMHPKACFMYARQSSPSTPFPIFLYVTDDKNLCDHLSTSSIKKFRDDDRTDFTIACKIPTDTVQKKQITN